MARDAGLEALVEGDLDGFGSLRMQPMFGGIAWLWRGNLLCGARADGILYRLGKGRDGWALDVPGCAPMVMGERRMEGWVRLSPDSAADDGVRQRFMAAAKDFCASLPAK